MPMQRPTLQQLIDQGSAEFESRLPGVLASLRRSVVGVINRVLAGALSALYQYAEWLNRQAWPDQADAEYLDDHGKRWGIERTPAAAATGTVRLTGIDGTAVPAGTTLMRSDGLLYTLPVDAIIAAGQALATAQALQLGAAGNAGVGTSLVLSSPVPGVSSVATTYTVMAGGADAEDDEPYRARILARIRQVPQGGSADDYVAWALQVPGVTRAWVSAGDFGAGSVAVRIMRDDDASPLPDAGELAAVQAHIDQLRPVTAAVYVIAPIAVPLNLRIQLLPDSAAARAAVTAELADLIRREAAPGSTVLLSHLREAISSAAGEFDHVLTVPAANVAHGAGEIATLGVITWV